MRDLSWQLQKLVHEFVFQLRRVVAAEVLAAGLTPGQRWVGEARGDQLVLTGRSFQELERAILAWALQTNDWNASRAARELRMSKSTFHDRAVRHQLIVMLKKRRTNAGAWRKRGRDSGSTS